MQYPTQEGRWPHGQNTDGNPDRQMHGRWLSERSRLSPLHGGDGLQPMQRRRGCDRSSSSPRLAGNRPHGGARPPDRPRRAQPKRSVSGLATRMPHSSTQVPAGSNVPGFSHTKSSREKPGYVSAQLHYIASLSYTPPLFSGGSLFIAYN